ncbi:MAG: PcfJ domain-containing protein [Isosphaeraceae bacterium]
MLDLEDWWESADPSEHRHREPTRLRPARRRSAPAEPASFRPRIRSPDACEALFETACHVREQRHAALLPEPRLLRHLAFLCQERSDLLAGASLPRYAAALMALSAHWRDWIRPPDDWQPPEGDPATQFGSLARHLLAAYDVPQFMDAAWRAGLTAEGIRQQGWFKWVGIGQNIRTAPDLPIPLTKRMAHHFVQAPRDLDFPSAFRWAQVRGLGGDDQLARRIVASRIGTEFDRDAFWVPVVRWLIDHPELAPEHHGPVIDYLHDQKFVASAPNPAGRVRGQPRQPLLVPPQPNLSLSGRTPETLLRAVDRWHHQLGTERRGHGVEWKPSNIPPFVAEVGKGATRQILALTELISAEELAEEGRALGHCVATYWVLCASGQSSIWSLTAENADGIVTRLLTVEVKPALRTIVQARGPRNHPAPPDQVAFLERWSEVGGPSLERWLVAEPPVAL